MEIEYQYYHQFVEVEMEKNKELSLFEGALNVRVIFRKWLEEEIDKNYGAFITFVGTVRAEDGIEALSFDIYEPILKEWFNKWQKKANERGAKVKMAHSIGDVAIHESSYLCAVFSPKRKVALELIEEFVEDFKANAPIWKYDVIDGKRVYAKDRSTPMDGAGVLDIN
jgi:molybdopterin synthase catalytic subunit